MDTRYTRTHEWIVVEEDGLASVGVTERVVLKNGRVVYLESSEEGAEYEQEEPIGVLETREGVELVYHAPARAKSSRSTTRSKRTRTLSTSHPKATVGSSSCDSTFPTSSTR